MVHGCLLHVDQVGVSRLVVHGCGRVGVYQDVKVGKVARGGRMLDGVPQVKVERGDLC